MRPFYRTKNQQASVLLYREDCVEAMKNSIPADSVDVVVTSPPYNIGARYSKYDDHLPRAEYIDWIESVGVGVRRVLSENGSFFLNIGSTPSDPWTPLDVAQRLRSHFVLQNVLHWVKSIAISPNSTKNDPAQPVFSVGHYKPLGGRRFLNDNHEYIFHFTKTGRVPLERLAIGVPYQDKSNIGRWKSARSDLHCRGNNWFIPYPTIQSRKSQRPHPSTFPDRLPEMCFRLHGIERIALAMDPFVGLGSSAIAAFRLGIPFIGFDIDESYLSETQRRLEKLRTDRNEGATERSEPSLRHRTRHPFRARRGWKIALN